MSQIAVDVSAEEIVCEKDGRKDGEVPGCPSSGLEHHKYSKNGNAHLEGIDSSSRTGNVSIAEDQVTEGKEGQSNQNHIEYLGTGQVFPLFPAGREEQECEQQ